MPDLPQTIPISGENVDPQIPAVLPPLDGLRFIPTPSNGGQLSSVANELEFNELTIDPISDRIIRVESLNVSEGAIRIIPRGNPPSNYVIVSNLKESEALHKEGVFDANFIFPRNLPSPGTVGRMIILFKSNEPSTKAFLSINGGAPIEASYINQGEGIVGGNIVAQHLSGIYANAVYNIRVWVSDDTGEPSLAEEVVSFRFDLSPAGIDHTDGKTSIEMNPINSEGQFFDLAGVDLGDSLLDLSGGSQFCTVRNSKISRISIRDSSIRRLSLTNITGLKSLDFTGSSVVGSGSVLELKDIQGPVTFYGINGLFSSIRISNIESLTSFELKENSRSEGTANESGNLLSDCPNLKSVRAVGHIIAPHESNPAYSPFTLTDNPSLDGDALDQFYEDLSDGASGTVIDVRRTLGAANHNPTIATNKGYVVIDS